MVRAKRIQNLRAAGFAPQNVHCVTDDMRVPFNAMTYTIKAKNAPEERKFLPDDIVIVFISTASRVHNAIDVI
jgi:hypothetical protein